MSVRSVGVGSNGGLSRREMLAALARWTAPTVLTLALAPRRAAAASCPPCTRLTGGRCRACTMNQILNCQCEPCLGAPYCAGGARAALMQPSVSGGNPFLQAPGGVPGAGAPLSPYGGRANPFARSPFSSTPYGPARPYGVARDSLGVRPRTLYDRLRSDQRRPF